MSPDSSSLGTLSLRGRVLDITRSLGQIDLEQVGREVQDAGAVSVWWGVLAAQAAADADRAKLAYDVTRAEIAQRHRRRLADTGNKVTEAMIDEAVTLDPDHQAAVRARITADENASVLTAVRFAVDRKQKTLENLSFIVAQERTAPAETPRLSPAAAQREALRTAMTAEPRGGRLPGRPPRTADR